MKTGQVLFHYLFKAVLNYYKLQDTEFYLRAAFTKVAPLLSFSADILLIQHIFGRNQPNFNICIKKAFLYFIIFS